MALFPHVSLQNTKAAAEGAPRGRAGGEGGPAGPGMAARRGGGQPQGMGSHREGKVEPLL